MKRIKWLVPGLLFFSQLGAAQENCVARTGAELAKPTFQVCAGCHGASGSPLGWLSGDAGKVWGEMQRLLFKGSIPYESPSRNGIIARPADPAVAHGGGKSFSPETLKAIVDFLGELEKEECIVSTNPNPTPTPVPTPPVRTPRLTQATFAQLEHLLKKLVRNPSGKTADLLARYKAQLGYPENRTQSDSRVPVTPVSMALLDRMLAWTCAEMVDARDWAVLSRTDFQPVFENFVSEMLALDTQGSKQVALKLNAFEDARSAAGKSVRASRVAMCFAVLKSERLWLH